MAELFLSPILQVVLEKLASPLMEKLYDFLRVRDNIEKLEDLLPDIQAFLDDAQKTQSADKVVENWIRKLRNIAYETEDLLDELAAEKRRCERRSGSRSRQTVFLPFEPSKHFFDLADKLPDKLKEFEKIVSEGVGFNLRATTAERCDHSLARRRKETGSSVVESKICGRDKDKDEILKILFARTEGEALGDVVVIPIVGIGGLGKTTLAQLVYNDEKVAHYFDMKIWVYVSQDFDVKKLIITIIESATRQKCELLEMDLLQSQLQDALDGKRFLIVFDDVWNEDQEQWEKLRDLFRSGAEGSRAIVTTRSMKVASVMGNNTPPYNLRGLGEDDCLVLFKQRAFTEGEELEHPRLLEIGKQIIKKCGGVPLAAKTLGSLCRFKREEEEWLFVQKSELWNLEESESSILPALKLSYFHLPLYLKRCFGFCSLYPKNYKIEREKMIRIWIAEGLIFPDGVHREPEDIGNEYFNDLLCLSFFQEVESCEFTKTGVYMMHDLIHDLARSVGNTDFMILGQDVSEGNMSRVHHLSVANSSDLASFPTDLFDAKHLRTLLFLFPSNITGDVPSFLPVNFIYLRVLNLSGCVKKVHESISALICLRYLDLSRTSIETLPNSICELNNLQTLDLSGCDNLISLPLAMPGVSGLRHLNILGCDRLNFMPPRIGKLVHLQTLPLYIVGRGIGETIAELESLNLRGELSVKGLENVRSADEAKKANMRAKRHVQLLRLQWGSRNDSADSSKSSAPVGYGVENVLEYLHPHENLRTLYIKGFPGKQFPGWALPNLLAVALINCRRCRAVPKLGSLPFLKKLLLQGMDSITCIGEEFCGEETNKPFPSLQELTLRELPNLETWYNIDRRVTFPLLQKLTMEKCPKLTCTPEFPSVYHLEIHDCHTTILNSLESISSLSSLVIKSIQGLRSFPGKLLENNPSLVSLEIRSCKSLDSLPPEMKELKALEFMEINGCHSLTSLPPEGIAGLSSLKNLSVENCSDLQSLSRGFNYLTALEQLSIMSCPELTLASDVFLNLSSLRSLNIVSCPELWPLPFSLQRASTLQSLVIYSCPGLTGVTDLPSWIGKLSSLRSLSISNCEYMISLPEELQHLSALQHLSIQDCPHLERLIKKRGLQWKRIAHIPHIYVSSLKLVIEPS